MLVEREDVHSKINIVLNLDKLDIYFPLDYQIQNSMLVLQINNVRAYSREHIIQLIRDDKKENNFARSDQERFLNS